MERSENRDYFVADRDRVLNIKPLRCLAPVFPSGSNFGSFPAPEGGFPHVYAPPTGPFPSGFTPFYPVVVSPESQRQGERNSNHVTTPGSQRQAEQSSHTPGGVAFRTPDPHAVPVNSYRTRQTTRSSQVRYFGNNGNDGTDDDGSSDVVIFQTADNEDTGTTKKRRGRPPKKAKNGNVDTDMMINNILARFDLSAFDNTSRLNGDKNTVGYILTIFDLIRRKATQNDELKGANPGAARRPDLKAGTVLMTKGVRTNAKKRFGAAPGVEVGDIFYFRMELCVVGLHSPSMGGIDYTTDLAEEPLAVSIVSSGGYEDNVEDANVLIYTGQGGKGSGKESEAKDQRLERGNLALEKSLHRGNEIRVIRGIKDPLGTTGKIYVYDGLYRAQESWVDRSKSGASIFKYKLVRLDGQPQVFTLWQSIQMWKNGMATRAGTILSDITSGAETLPVALINDVDGEKGPAYFTYFPSLLYTKPVNLMEPSVSCNCTGGCFPGNNSCSCILKNGGHLPCNANGILVTKKSMIYECGPSCHCPPNCNNRVSQSGIKVRLEVFRTQDKGWGLRSWDPIRAGAYVCEYAGEVIDKSKVNNQDDYIFDATRSCEPLEFLPADFNEDPKIPFPLYISAKTSGNVARFMNHSCSPNVFWQPVMRGNKSVYDIHIVFHAIKHIPPMVELTYNYGIVHGDIANQWKKRCLCRSEKCRGYFY